MTIPFGPRLIGMTEKALNAVLDRHLQGTELTEAQWVTLRVAELLDAGAEAADLVAAVTDKAKLRNAADLVEELARRGLLEGGRLSPAGRELVAAVQGTITAETAPIWDDLPVDDVAAATRVLNEVLARAHALV